MPLLKYSINQAKSHFFDKDIVGKWEKTAAGGLSKWGSFTRRTAKSKLRKARQKKIAELTKKERQRFRIAQEIAKRDGLSRPKKPPAPSAPGEPPRMHSGEIKKFLYFTYEPKTNSVLVGPALLDRPTGAPEKLEKGGWVDTSNGRAKIAQRPFMKPSFDENINKLPRLVAGLG